MTISGEMRLAGRAASRRPRRRLALLPALLTWAGCTALFGLVLYCLSALSLQRWVEAALVRAHQDLLDGDITRATMNTDWWHMAPQVPAGQLAGFAVVGLAVLAVAWAGHRRVAWVLPLACTALTIGPSLSWFPSVVQPWVPHPFGDHGGDVALWTALAVPAGARDVRAEVWPYVLGATVQVVLLAAPLLLVPQREAGRRVSELVLPAWPVALLTGAVLYVAAGSWSTVGQTAPVALALLVIGLAAVLRTLPAPRSLRYVTAGVLPGLVGAALFPLTLHSLYWPTTDPPPWMWLVVSAVTAAYLAGHDTWQGRRRASAEEEPWLIVDAAPAR